MSIHLNRHVVYLKSNDTVIGSSLVPSPYSLFHTNWSWNVHGFRIYFSKGCGSDIHVCQGEGWKRDLFSVFFLFKFKEFEFFRMGCPDPQSRGSPLDSRMWNVQYFRIFTMRGYTEGSRHLWKIQVYYIPRVKLL